MKLPDEQVLHHIVDVHCHPTDAPSISADSMERLQITICAMSTMQSDQQRVRGLANAYPSKVIPCFVLGYHPWFTHFISTQPGITKDDHYRRLFLSAGASMKPDFIEAYNKLLALLPDPTPLSDIILDLRNNLGAFPKAMLGEVGLDRIFRVPFDYFASTRELTPFTIPLDHQLNILEAQIELAIELGRNISFHSVKSQLATTDFLKKMQNKHGENWRSINVDMHSCGLSPETWRDIERRHPNIFLSFSTVINSRSSNHKALIGTCSANRLLVESDYNNVEMCTPQTWEMINTMAEVKGWSVEEQWVEDIDESEWGVVRKLEQNWFDFRRN